MRIAKLHYITQDLEGVSHRELAEEACRGGVRWVQARIKGKDFPIWLQIVREVKEVCDRYGAVLIVNDSPEIALQVGAHGVHLGKHDMDPVVAREILMRRCIIGGTANTLEDVERLVAQGVDYIGIGPFRFTQTKKDLSPVLSREMIITMVQRSRVPLIAIGGIRVEDLQDLLGIGVYGVAVAAAVNHSPVRPAAAQRFMEAL